MIDFIVGQRLEYLGHILRMHPDRALRRFLLELSPNQAPFKQGSLLSEAPFHSINEMVQAAEDRDNWRHLCKTERNNRGESRASLGTARSRWQGIANYPSLSKIDLP